MIKAWKVLGTAATMVALVACNPPNASGGTSDETIQLPETGPLHVFTFRPDGCAITGVLLVFHGVDRNAGPYRDAAIPLAQRNCMLVVAPLFDAARYPSWRYQRGGVVDHGAAQPAASWTVNVVPSLVTWARAREGRADLPATLIGHSAGAQFLSRVAAYGPGGAERIVIANPSTWVRPSLDDAAPYGFGKLYGPAEGAAALQRYLALPITVLLGQDDTGTHNLATEPEAEAQGPTRLARGETVFKEAQAMARAHGWAFNWHLATIPGVGHNARLMFTSDAAFAALARP